MASAFQRPFSIRIFVPGGDPDGLRIVEKSNWTGVGVVFNRTNYKEVIERPEFAKTGVYILVGTTPDSLLLTVYIGEGDPIKERLTQHYGKKEFWEWCVFFVTKDGSLNKAHVQHLEARLHCLAVAAKQCNLDNRQAPLEPSLSEAERADVESFLTDMLSIFPLLGLSVFERAESNSRSKELLFIDAKGVKATGYEDPKGFVVSQGSQMVMQETPTIHEYLKVLRRDLASQAVVTLNGQHYVFEQDHAFGSPSTAAGVILGRSANGRTEWKTREGHTLKEVQEATSALSSVTPTGFPNGDS
jgi:hypothetical protein